MHGTIRALDEETRRQVREAVRRVTEQTAAAFGARAELTLTAGYPVTVNHPAATALFLDTARALLGGAHVRDDVTPSLGAEDFAYYLKHVPGAFWRVGVATPGDPEPVPLHNPRFDFPDAALPMAIRVHVALARRFARDWQA